MDISRTIEEVKYPAPYWWNPSVNKEANISNCMANCTCYVYGETIKNGIPIVNSVSDARSFHEHLINGWMAVPYSSYKNNIKVGDVIEWISGNHVAIVSDVKDEIWISASFYTGINGVAYKDGKYDTRDGFKSLEQVNDFMIKNYPYRFFHNVTLDEEMKWCGGEPELVLVSPSSIIPVERDNSKSQVYVGVQGLRVRTEPNTDSAIRGVCPNGYFNIDEIVIGGSHENGNKWYKIGSYFIADVQGVTYYPKEEVVPIEQMIVLMKTMQEEYIRVCNERDEYKRRLQAIRELSDE